MIDRDQALRNVRETRERCENLRGWNAWVVT